jgi:hypothetical protein
MQPQADGAGHPAGAQPYRQVAGLPAFQEDAVLRNARRRRRARLNCDSLRGRAADFVGSILDNLGTVDLAARIPRFLLEVCLLEEDEVVRAQPLEAPIPQLLRPHGRDQVAEIFDELPVLHGANGPTAEGFAGNAHA